MTTPSSHLTSRRLSFFFSPAPTILPHGLSPAPNGLNGNTILARVFAANAPPIHALYILSRRAILRDFVRLPGRRHPHPPEPAPSGHHRPRAQQSRVPVRCGDRPVPLPPAFQSPRAGPHRAARDGT